MNASDYIQAEISKAIMHLRRFGDVAIKERQRIAALGGAYMAAAADSAAPRSKKIHKIYSTAKAARALRAPKGMGNVVATYYPGNLAQSMQVMKFNRAKSKVYVGARLARNARGDFGRGKRADGYYLHMLEFGTQQASAHPFFQSSTRAATGTVMTVMAAEWRRVGAKFEQSVK